MMSELKYMQRENSNPIGKRITAIQKGWQGFSYAVTRGPSKPEIGLKAAVQATLTGTSYRKPVFSRQ